MDTTLQFTPFASTIDHGFWYNFSGKKLDEYKLSTDPIKVYGYYTNGNAPGLPTCMNVDYTAFDKNFKIPSKSIPVNGNILNFNLSNDLKNADKNIIIQESGREIWNEIVSGSALSNPSLLNRFVMISYADLKKFQFYYWFAFPAINFQNYNCDLENSAKIDKKLSKSQISQIQSGHDQLGQNQRSHFFIRLNDDKNLSCHPLKELKSVKPSEKVIIAFSDPSCSSSFPGWPLRNLIALLIQMSMFEEVEILCFRDRFKDGCRISDHSLLLTIKLPKIENCSETDLRFVGWEKNERQRLGPRFVNLSKTMDPVKIAESSVDLNLKLMRWRLLPSLDLDLIKNTKCLLLGSGTLGCNIARCLLGWGVRNITMVDNSTVSYSNPVRQSLFTFEDSLNGGLPKSEAAVKSLKLIYPGCNATSVELSIPMPGHPVADSLIDQIRKDVETLETLIEEHDAIFLLMDTRESRWLPTLVSASKKKIVITAALGFDTYLIMRHGLKSGQNTSYKLGSNSIPGTELGCYFCNDVVAPGDSTADRTLDQACTVSRPGSSMLASALAVELLVSILQHTDGAKAPAEAVVSDDLVNDDDNSILGLVPHQIRGFLSRFSHVLPATAAFVNCTACSSYVLEKYESEGFDFLLKAFDNPLFLEDICGLSQLHSDSLAAEVWELSD